MFFFLGDSSSVHALFSEVEHFVVQARGKGHPNAISSALPQVSVRPGSCSPSRPRCRRCVPRCDTAKNSRSPAQPTDHIPAMCLAWDSGESLCSRAPQGALPSALSMSQAVIGGHSKKCGFHLKMLLRESPENVCPSAQLTCYLIGLTGFLGAVMLISKPTPLTHTPLASQFP